MRFLRKVVECMCTELEEADSPAHTLSEPMLDRLHGGPGTGKSCNLKLLKELFTHCGWTMGSESHVAALQAVTAEQLGSDTIHHATGITPFGAAPEGQKKDVQC